MLSALGAIGAVLGLSWALLGALEKLSGTILNDLGSLQHVLSYSLEENRLKDALYVGFSMILNEIYTLRTSNFAVPCSVFKVFHFGANSHARCFPSALEALKVIQEGSKILLGASQEGPKDAQEASKRLLRGAQDGPRRFQGLTSGSKIGEIRTNKWQEGSKRRFGAPFWCPRGAQDLPRGSQKVPKRYPGGLRYARIC